MKIVLLVPRRPDGGHRDRLWVFCRAAWEREFPDFEIHEGLHLDGPFNRSAAVNAAAAAAGAWDLALVIDSDIVIDPELVRKGLDRAVATGRVVLPFDRRMMVTEAGTALVLDGHVGSWVRFARLDRYRDHASSCVVVPRAAWDAVGGFDDRFVGWGGEDDAFWAACDATAGTERLPGQVWHLWHPSAAQTHTPLYRRNLALLSRYRHDPAAAIAERHNPTDPDAIAVCVLTNGRRRDLLAATIASADANLKGNIARRVILADRANVTFDGWDTIAIKGGNFWRAMGSASVVAAGLPEPWIYWIEDDFTHNHVVDLDAMRRTLAANPNCVQMSLMRQAWYQLEVAAGGVREQRPEQFTDMGGWLAHRWYWTQNPMLMPRWVYEQHPWPQGASSEAAFGVEVLADPDRVAGVWGSMDTPPAVTHIGEVRAGRGY